MKWSWKIARLAGIDVYMHWTFLLLLGWIVFMHLSQGQGMPVVLRGIGFVMAVFGCIVLHELGHALAARRYGIQTRDITLLPIGGLARLERMPEQPGQELWVALAGPAVNVVIAGLLGAVLFTAYGLSGKLPSSLVGGDFVENLMWVNVVLVVFNLLPAFPMDGGRALRALLAYRLNYARATEIAANVGQAIAILFGFVGLFYNPLLLFIALFVYLGAEAEARTVQMKSILAGLPVRDAMMVRYRAFQPGDTLQTAADELLAGTQQDFPVVEHGRLLGMVGRQAIVDGLAQRDRSTPVTEIMDRETPLVDEREMLDRVSQRMQERNISAIPVQRNGVLVGIVSLENVGELMMIRSALRQRLSANQTDPLVPATRVGDDR